MDAGNDGLQLEWVEVPPREGTEAGVVVWMHGLGADGHDFEPVVPMLNLPRVRFVFPHAPRLPVTINGGMVMPAWYDIRSLDNAPDRESAEDIRRSAAAIEAVVTREEDRVGSTNVVVAGFSQGAAMALHVALRHPRPLAGVVALSGYVVLAPTLDTEARPENRDTPIFLGHGTHDPMVPVFLGEQGRDTLHALNPERSLVWKTYPMGHQVCPEELADLAAWFQARF